MDRITLFISRDGAEREGNKAIRPGVTNFKVTPATLRDEDTGHLDRGFKVTLLNAHGHPIGNL